MLNLYMYMISYILYRLYKRDSKVPVKQMEYNTIVCYAQMKLILL